jgi:hypothetical protein
MSYWMQLADGTSVHVNCAAKHNPKYCACGRIADYLCDWRMPAKKSGTCDGPICKKCAEQVAPDKHLCPFHQKAFEHWKKRHPDKVPYVAEQLRLGI